MWRSIQSSRQQYPPHNVLILYMTKLKILRNIFNLLFEKKVVLRDNLAVFDIPPHNVVRQRLSKHIEAATNTHAKIEGLLDGSFSLRFVLYQKKQLISPSQNFFLYIYTLVYILSRF
jgi:hypothetical protein